MLFAPFSDRCPDVVEKETLSLTIGGSDEVPDGQYLLAESYCVDSECDCRKVMINFFSSEQRQGVSQQKYVKRLQRHYKLFKQAVIADSTA